MKKRTGAFLKQGLAVMMSLSLAFGPCAPGVMPVFGAKMEAEISEEGEVFVPEADFEIEDVEAETASASDAVAATETEAVTASDSDAQFDEDGFLMDGEVADDVTVEIEEELIEAPEKKTEMIAPELAGDEWYKDFAYTVNSATRTITLKHYEGEDAMVWVEGTAQYNGRTYTVKIAEPDFYEGLFSGNTYVEDVTIRDIKLPKESAWMFSYCSNLVNVELYSADFSAVTSMAYMFSNCSSLENIDLSGWDTTNVTDMAYMFSNCSSLENIDLSSWDTHNVTDMSWMFYGCNALKEINMSGVDMSSVTHAHIMLNSCSSLARITVPVGLTLIVDLPNAMAKVDDGTLYIQLPKEVTDSFVIDADAAPYVPAEGVKISMPDKTIEAGKTLQLEAWVQPDTASNRRVTWSSSDTTVARVDSTGLVTGQKNGNAIITATSVDGGYTASCTITVGIPVRIIGLDSTWAKMTPNATMQLNIWLEPTNATNKEVIWSSSNPEVATVDSTGWVKGINYGTAVITVKTVDGGKTATCHITVKEIDWVTGVKINSTAKTMEVGKTFQLKAWPQPVTAINKNVTWSSSNPEVATVDDNGLVTALTVGTSVITVKTEDGGRTAFCTITVSAVAVNGVKINTTEKTITAGSTFQLAAWPQPVNASNKAVTWSSSDTSVATVDSTGLVKAVKAGTATVTVKTVDGGYTATCTITVIVPVTGVTLDRTQVRAARGESFTLAAAITPENATNKALVCTSSNAEVAFVESGEEMPSDDNDIRIAANAPGTAVITVTSKDGGYSASCQVTVVNPVTGVIINSTERTIKPGYTFQLAAWPQPSDATDRSVTWSSSDPSVATVDSTGLVKAVKAGTATITVTTTDGGYTAACKITVTIPVTSVILNTTEKTMVVGKTFQLAAWPQPANATDRSVTWTSSNSNIAKVSAGGLVTAVKKGTAVITAKSVNGKTATCMVTVETPTVAVTGIKINATVRNVEIGKTFQLAAWPQPTNATNKVVTWTSSNTAVATVSSTGLVKGVKNGTAAISVKTADGGFTKTCKITVGTPVTGVKINAAEKAIAPGKSFQLAAWPQPANATNKTVTWSSSNENVAMVSSTGLVIGVKAGTATITVKTVDGGFTATCKVTVKAATVAVTSVKINTTAKSLAVGKTFQLAAWPQPSNATNKAVTWTSSNENVAMVNSSGLVIGVKPGTATITVTTADGGYTATCKITANVPVTGVKINSTAKTIKAGSTFQLAAWPQPSNATNKNVTWTSSNKAIATVSSTGLVKAVKKGTATITVKTADGGKTATCKITVN